MKIDERSIALACEDDVAKASEVGWFAAKQPALLRYLEDRLGDEPDALAIAIEMSWRVVAAFERQRAMPLPRLQSAELERAEEEVVRESLGGLEFANGCAHRQPDLCEWLAKEVLSPALPIDPMRLEQVALAVAATISACDWAHTLTHAGGVSLESAGDTLLL